jgi:uncharacterized protein YutE (UPF0331/DUF86 family)/predicted nucleotidyltransferase
MRKIYFAAWLIVTGCSVVVDGAEIKERVLIDRLRDALEKEENVLLAYLFGSRAAGKASSVSDFDLAVLLKDNSLVGIGCVLFSASRALGVNEDAVDILDLSKAPLRLKVKVLKEGVKLVDRGYEEAVIQDVNKNFPEIALEIRKELRWWISNPRGIDIELIKELLDYLAQVNGHLESFLSKRRVEELSSNAEAWYALKSMVQDIIQAVIDICAHIVSAKQLGIVSAYREYVERLVEHGLMEPTLGERIKTMIILRNRLIHRYLTVKPEELWSWSMKLSSEIVPEFKEWVLKLTSSPP